MMYKLNSLPGVHSNKKTTNAKSQLTSKHNIRACYTYNMFSLVSSEGVHTNHKRISILLAQIQDFE